MRFHIALVLSLAVAVLSPRAGHAWNPPGHMLSGALAYRELSAASPATRAKVSELLRAHPHFQTEWQPLMARLNIPPEQQDAFLFMQAARWPDDIRSIPFHRGSWHYINHRFAPQGRPRLTPVRASEDEQRGNIEGAFIRNQRILLDPGKPADERAVALCWLFHLIGDVHQPLHTVALFSPRFPEGDRGGNEFFIRAEEGARTLGLHALWDGILLGDQRFSAVDNEATVLRMRGDLQRASLAELRDNRSFEDWSRKESVPAAMSIAYAGGNLVPGQDEHSGELLPPGYLTLARSTAERRLMLAGYRMADKCREWFGQ